MRNLEAIKKIYLVVLLMFTGIFVSNANVNVSGIFVNSEYLVSGRLNVPNPAVPTKFKFRVDLSRTMLAGAGINYSDGTATITLVHRYNASLGGNEIAVSSPINISNADYNGGGFITINNAPGELPANIQSGSLLVKLTYWNSDQNKTLTIFVSDKVVNIQPPARVPIYQWAGTMTGDYRLALTEPVGSPSKWMSRGIYFYGYNAQVPGTVPIYEFEGHVNNANGEPEFPENLTYYSTSTQTPTTLPGLGSAWTTVTPKVLFYAFLTQVEGTVPVYCYSNAQGNNFLFMATGEISDIYTRTHIAFYAYPYVWN